MDLYSPALMLLAGAVAIHNRASVPELRPASDMAEATWRILARLASLSWLGLLVWGWFTRPWQDPALALALSVLASVVLALAGPRPGWWGFSMAMGVLGLALSALLVLR